MDSPLPPHRGGGAIVHAPPPMTMSDEDADELRSKGRSWLVGEWVADDAPVAPCVSVTNNAFTVTYVGHDRVFETDSSSTVKCCCCAIQHVTSKGTFDEDGLGGRMEDDRGLKTTYTLVSLDKVSSRLDQMAPHSCTFFVSKFDVVHKPPFPTSFALLDITMGKMGNTIYPMFFVLWPTHFFIYFRARLG